jgi:hypothetical protein
MESLDCIHPIPAGEKEETSTESRPFFQEAPEACLGLLEQVFGEKARE